MPVESLRTLQVKFTYGGGQKKPTPTLLFTSVFSTPDVARFRAFYSTDFNYGNDEEVQPTFSAQLSELKAVIDSVGTLPDVVDGGVDPGGLWSFSLQNYYGGTSKVFESILNQANGRALFRELLEAFANDASARTGLTGYACAIGMMSGTPPQDVTGSGSVSLRGVRLDRKTGWFVGKLRVTNTSGGTIQAPIIAALSFKGSVALAVQEGVTTCLVPPFGTPYVTLSASPLGPGQTAQVKVSLANPDNQRIELQAVRILAGEGTP